MNSFDAANNTPDRSPDDAETVQDQGTGLPGFRRWSIVYLLVGGLLVVYVLLLTALTRLYR